jgi:hypothetical protein
MQRTPMFAGGEQGRALIVIRRVPPIVRSQIENPAYPIVHRNKRETRFVKIKQNNSLAGTTMRSVVRFENMFRVPGLTNEKLHRPPRRQKFFESFLISFAL